MIPQSKDTREVLGPFAGNVSNRSLLFDKLVLPKTWGHEERFHDATRFNVLRACTHGPEFLRMAAAESQQKIQSDKTKDEVKARNRYRKRICDELASIKLDDSSLSKLCVERSLSLLTQIQRSYPNRNRTFVGELGGRLLINMAGGVQENAGIALDRCFGLPLIPGSAVKGVSRHTALWAIRSAESDQEKRRLLRLALLVFGFGEEDLKHHKSKTNWAWAAGSMEILHDVLRQLPPASHFKGLVSFLPASPASENMRIVAEGLTPHTDQKTAEESQKLNPLTFPAVERGSQFAFALVLNRQPENGDEHTIQEVLDQAEAWLKQAVTGTGIGAKTSAGYGWVTLDESADAQWRDAAAQLSQRQKDLEERKKKAAAEAAAEAERLASMSPAERLRDEIASLNDPAFAEKAKQVSQNLATNDEVLAFFEVLKSAPKKDRRKQWKKNKADLWAALQEAAKSVGLSLD